MPNSFFRFKQFTIHQSDAVLKVSTEACILGAWATAPPEATRILDVGAGTGLLALMLAQRYAQAQIDAVEINETAARQAAKNAATSPFADRIRVVHESIQHYARHPAPYDLIVSNPPFYQQSLHSPDTARNAAKHAETLSFDDLLDAVGNLLAPAGTFVVLLPPYETNQFLPKAAETGLFLRRQLRVRHRPGGQLFRLISAFGFSEKLVVFEELSIYKPDGGYSPEFVALLKDFYMKF